MVATSFSSDTPLAVTGIVVKDGVAGNWLWWNFMLGGALTVLFFAHLWRRAAGRDRGRVHRHPLLGAAGPVPARLQGPLPGPPRLVPSPSAG
ncbi:MAG: hypothetical protein MZW92_03250 [Comamonadaceae bacterium]|nr:hypothetical protein [Comamonadaceae bacterium]